MNFCPDCGGPIRFAVPDGDDRQRNICTRCGDIFYKNPLNVVGCVVEHEGKILLCKRAINPRKHFWTLPAGFMELDETMADGALRETREEACAQACIDALFALIDLPHIGQVHVFFRAHLAKAAYAAGPESTDVALVSEEEIPWSQLAFPSIHRTLSLYFANRARERFDVHEERIDKGAWQTMGLDKTPLLDA